MISVVALVAATAAVATVIDPSATEPEALEVAIEATLDRDVDPCDDFYAFACGGWLSATELPPDRPTVGRGFTSIMDRNREIVRGILDDAAEGRIEADPRLGAFYASCLNTEAIEAAGIAPLHNDFKRIAKLRKPEQVMTYLGQSPMLDAFFGGGVDADLRDPSVNVLHLSQGGLGLPDRKYYFPEDDEGRELLAAYELHIAQMLELSGLPRGRARKDAKRVLALETRLAEASRSRVQMRDVLSLDNPMSRADLSALTPTLPWDAFFDAMDASSISGVNVMTPDYFSAFERELSEGDWRATRAYLRWRLVSAAAGYLPAAFDDAHFAFYGKRLNGQQQQEDRWKRCVTRTDGSIGDLLGKAYVDVAFAGDSKEIGLRMVADIQAAFEAGLPDLAWMDDATRAAASEKLASFVKKIGYPDSLETYEGLALDGAHVDHARAVAAWKLNKELSEVGEPVDPDKWYMTPPTVNAYYNPTANEIVFPAGIMQPPFFHADYPAALNYGAMGMVIGHEFTHGFDDEGRKFAPDGALREWWAPEASERFEEAAQCVEELYASFEVLPGVFLDGKLTLGENIADLGGLKLSGRAYARWREDGGQDPTLAGFTPEQLLYVGYAQSWCTLRTPEMERMRATTDPHSAPRFRVNGAVSQTREFAEAFGCEIGSPMAPERICEVW